jgi:hypothetical protein
LKRTILCVALFSIATLLPAQNDLERQYKTGPQYNGHFWVDMAPEHKVAYLSGYGDALNTVTLLDGPAVNGVFPFGLRMGEIVKGIDRFYDTPENLRITIAGAIAVFNARFAGVSEDKIQKGILELREEAAAALRADRPAAPPTAQQ